MYFSKLGAKTWTGGGTDGGVVSKANNGTWTFLTSEGGTFTGRQGACESEATYRPAMLEIALGVGDDPEPVVPDTIPEEWLGAPPPD